MNLYLLRQINADDFYKQDWYMDEPFMKREPERELPIPEGFERLNPNRFHVLSQRLPSAIEYAHLYVKHLELEIWEKFLWTRDTDRLGQRIYVGGVNQGKTKGFQIHRHLHIDEKWGVPVFKTE